MKCLHCKNDKNNLKIVSGLESKYLCNKCSKTWRMRGEKYINHRGDVI